MRVDQRGTAVTHSVKKLKLPGQCIARLKSQLISTMHYSYDFAQQVHFPFDCQQSGPAYFTLK